MARKPQQGLTLIEVMVALVLLSSGLLAMAALQGRALQGSDGARITSQVAWLAQGMLERARSAGGIDAADRLEFQQSVEAFVGGAGQGKVREDAGQVRVSIDWSEERTGGGQRLHELGGVR